MNCKHPRLHVAPDKIKKVGDGVTFDLKDGYRLTCAQCDEQLASEDLYLWPKEAISVLIPTELVDGGNNEQ